MSSDSLIHSSSTVANPWMSRSAWKPYLSEQALLEQQLHTKFFCGTATISPSHVALRESASEGITGGWGGLPIRLPPIGYSPGGPRQTYWTSGVGPKGGSSGCGIGICRYSNIDGKWRSYSGPFDRGTSDLIMLGIYAISKALRIAYKACRDTTVKQRPRNVRIYSDCMFALKAFTRFQKSLDHLRTHPKFQPQQLLILSGLIAAEDLHSLGIDVQLLYVPRQGNLRANEAARRGARRPIPSNLGRMSGAPQWPGELTAEWPTLPPPTRLSEVTGVRT